MAVSSQAERHSSLPGKGGAALAVGFAAGALVIAGLMLAPRAIAHPADAADLAVELRAPGTLPNATPREYEVIISNVSRYRTWGEFRVESLLPEGLGVISFGGPGWSCERDRRTVTCVREDAVHPGETATPIKIAVKASADGELRDVETRATVEIYEDPHTGNNVDSALTPTGPRAEIRDRYIARQCSGGTLRVSPGAMQVGDRGARVVALVRGKDGAPAEDVPVVVRGHGPDSRSRTAVTDGRGKAAFQLRSTTRQQRWTARVPQCELRASLVSLQQASLPASAYATVAKVRVRSHPRAGSRRVATLPKFRFDFRPSVFLIIERRLNSRGELWLKTHIPGRPNGRRGWVRASELETPKSVAGRRIVLDLSRRRLELKRGSRTVLSATAAIGKRSAPTPTGRFYITAAFRPDNNFLGPWAFETSAYAAITDWPRGGIVGLHGTSAPGSVGKRASHGCIRVYNSVITALKRRVEPGTPLIIKR